MIPAFQQLAYQEVITVFDDKFNEKRSSEQELPKHYLKKCQELFRKQNRDESRNKVRRLFSEGVVLLVNSCSGPSSDSVQSACFKLLYLADLFYKRFKLIIVDDKELLDIKPYLHNGKFSARDNRRRKPVTQRRRSSVPVEFQQQLYHRRGSREVIEYHVRLCMSFILGVFTTLLGIIFGRGGEHLNENNEDGLEGDLSD
ncbi:Hypothetical predicted protein [Paramuricea clavata]|uniref:Uncharacterized protein n=1 Tax=Paramuricea clavata TaxID=317549 RepID=A0A6S7JQK7_PARCT|nr:Hypothetical predicted protein [Paramuricea clavata]